MVSRNLNEYLQIDLLSLHAITSIKTQGKKSDKLVSSPAALTIHLRCQLQVDSARVRDRSSPRPTWSSTGDRASATNGSDGKTYREKR